MKFVGAHLQFANHSYDEIEKATKSVPVHMSDEGEEKVDLLDNLPLYDDVKKKVDSESDSGVISLGLSEIEEASTEYDRNIYQDLQNASGVTEEQSLEIEEQVLNEAKEEYGFFGGPDQEEVSASFSKHGVRLGPTPQETYEKNKGALRTELAEVFDLEEDQVTDEEMKGYYYPIMRSRHNNQHG